MSRQEPDPLEACVLSLTVVHIYGRSTVAFNGGIYTSDVSHVSLASWSVKQCLFPIYYRYLDVHISGNAIVSVIIIHGMWREFYAKVMISSFCDCTVNVLVR